MKTIVFALAIAASVGTAASAPASGTSYPVGISFVREMEYIPEVDSWQHVQPGQWSADSIAVDSLWDSVHVWVRQQYSPATVRALSNWSKVQMAAYKRTPKIKNLTFTPIRVHDEHKMLVFEAIADSLPVHAPIVTRHLKLYLLYDRDEHKLVDVTVTIRGQVLE